MNLWKLCASMEAAMPSVQRSTVWIAWYDLISLQAYSKNSDGVQSLVKTLCFPIDASYIHQDTPVGQKKTQWHSQGQFKFVDQIANLRSPRCLESHCWLCMLSTSVVDALYILKATRRLWRSQTISKRYKPHTLYFAYSSKTGFVSFISKWMYKERSNSQSRGGAE